MPSPLVERAVIDALDNNNALLKYISPNDTGLTGGHQRGYYLPKAAWRTFTPHAPERGQNAEHLVNVLWQDGRNRQRLLPVIYFQKEQDNDCFAGFRRDD